MIITALLQVYNEKHSGHLERFLKWNNPLYDNFVVLDDRSTDDSVEFIKPHASLLIENNMNSFRSELQNKGLLLNSAKEAFPDTDWFLWLDADELLLEDRTRIDSLLAKASSADFDGIELPLVNLWRSEHFYRIDSGFNEVKNVRFWRNKTDLNFSKKTGLHGLLHPLEIKKVLEMDELKVLHFGFSSALLIANKFSIYKENGQRGRNLLRLIDETNLQVENVELQKLSLGSRFENYYQKNSTVDFLEEKVSLRKYLDLANTFRPEKDRKPAVTLISLIYAGVDWLEFQYSELLKLRNEFGPDEVEILFIANNASESVIKFLDTNFIPYRVAPGRKSQSEWYINSVYRAYNFGVKEAKGDYVLLTNSDMSYAPGFLYSMMQQRSPSKYLVGKLVESGRLKPSNLAIKKNLGKTLEKFKRKKFYRLANKIASNSLSPAGLFMPCLVDRQVFLDRGGFPEGNLVPQSLESYVKSGNYVLALQGDPVISGDFAFVKRLESEGFQHETVNSAIAYHFQEGEKSEVKASSRSRVYSGILVDGTNSPLLHSIERFSSRLDSEDFRLKIYDKFQTDVHSYGIVMDDFQDFYPKLDKELNGLKFCITSNEMICRKFAMDFDIHTYYLDKWSTRNSEDFCHLVEQILVQELHNTFILSGPVSIRKKISKAIPTALKLIIKSWLPAPLKGTGLI